MSNASPTYDDRFIDLIVQRSTSGLSEADHQEFNNLAHLPKNESEAERYELTAAAVNLAIGAPDRESMPREIHDRLLMAAGSFFREGSDVSPAVSPVKAIVELSDRRAASRYFWPGALALAALAACMMLMLSGIFNQPTAAERLQNLTDLQPSDLVKVGWEPVHVPNVVGEAIWSDSRQEGYMKFTGMPINNPTVEQYQLWIFDTEEEYAAPVDGGVFDISAAGEVVIPIKAHKPIEKAVRFAVTREKPGGVYVSQREHIPVQGFVN